MSPFRTKHKFWGCLLGLGISSVSVQLVMVREIMSTFSGNELIIGVVIGSWLLFTGLGSTVGVKVGKNSPPDRLLFWGHVLVALCPFAQILVIRALPLLLVRGEIHGLGVVLGTASLTLLPYCLTGGLMIPLAGSFLSGRQTTTRVYIADTIGDILGGLLFSLVLVYLFSHWTSLIFLALLNLFAAAMMAGHPLRLTGLAVCALIVVLSHPIDKTSISWRFPGQEIILHKNTPFAQLTITRSGKQLNVFQDAIPTFSTHALDMEATAHLPLSQVDKGARVLLIAGGIFGTLNEIIKHDPTHVDYVELDPAIVSLAQRLDQTIPTRVVDVHLGDGRLFVKKTPCTYDVVIVDLPDPENAQLNRFYTKEFFHEVKSILSPSGVLSFTLVGAENYMEETGLALNRSVYSALGQTFDEVLVLPGSTHHFMASDGTLTQDIESILTQRHISTKRLIAYDLSTLTDAWRIDKLSALLGGDDIPPNSDLSPRAFGYLLDMWLKKTHSSRGMLYIGFFVIAVFAFIASRKEPIHFTIMTSGYAAMAFELTLILLFQLIYGYAYLRMCILITLFMIGSVTGALWSGRWTKSRKKQVVSGDMTLVALAAVAWVTAVLSVRSTSAPLLFWIQYLLIPLLVFLVAAATGWQFSAASRACRGSGSEITGRLYGADLAGAACGTILTGLLFIPSMGIGGVLMSIIILKGLSLVFIRKSTISG